jgi:hypothetical protein
VGARIGRTAVGYRLDLTGVVVDADRFAAATASRMSAALAGRMMMAGRRSTIALYTALAAS